MVGKIRFWAKRLFVPVNEECIQIHHTGHDHWVCSTSIDGFVRLYDSMRCKQLTSSMKVQLSQCYHTLVKNNLLEVELPPRQIQRGGVDCGVFAIAFAFELAAGKTNPSHVTYDQSKMRQHLLTSLQKGSFEPFPRANHKNSVPFEKQYNHCEIEAFCHCLMPECWADMIQCEMCDNWFHMICEHLENESQGESLQRMWTSNTQHKTLETLNERWDFHTNRMLLLINLLYCY